MNSIEKPGYDLIRRADWRFLLSNPKPVKSIFFGGNVFKDVLEIISEHVIDSSTNPADTDFELAAPYEPDTETIGEIFSILRPGGDCYIEWRLPLFARIKSLEMKLAATGFRNIRSYIPIPNLIYHPARIWIPIDAPEAISYSLSLYFKDANKKNFIKKAREILWSLSPKLIALFPWLLSRRPNNLLISTTARKPALSPNNHHREAKRLMLTEGDDIDNKPVFFLFAEKEKYPSSVIKVTRLAEYAYQLENEVKILQTIEQEYPGVKGIPKVLFADHSSGFFTVGESCIPGTQVSKILTKKNYRDLALKTTSWLIELGVETRTTNRHGTELSDSVLSELITHLDISDGMAQRTGTIIKGLRLRYSVCEHRDFAPQNVLIDTEGNLGVIDWEESRLIGIPALDLIFFLILLSLNLENVWRTGKHREAYRNLLNPDTFTGGVFSECTDLYLSKLEIDPGEKDGLRILAILTWIHTHKAEFVNNQPSLSSHVFYHLWEEELLAHSTK